MRKVDKIIIHCTATPEDRHVSVEEIEVWHKQRGFNEIGYHFVVLLSGEIAYGRDITKIGAHCKGHNANSVGVAYVGGLDYDMNPKDTRTNKQKESLNNLVKGLLKQFPNATVHGHNDFSNKSCPSFDVKKEL